MKGLYDEGKILRPRRNRRPKNQPSSELEDYASNNAQLFSGAISGREKRERLFPDLELNADADNRPLYVCPDGHIFLETFNRFYKPAYEFVVAIAEPITRPKYIQEYQITTYSLFAAVSIGYTASDIISGLSKLSKCKITKELTDQIEIGASRVGKVKLILRRNRYFVESSQLAMLQLFASDEQIAKARIDKPQEGDIVDPITKFLIVNEQEEGDAFIPGIGEQQHGAASAMGALGLKASDEEVSVVRRFEIDPQYIENVRRRALQLQFPMSDEYDFRNETLLEDLDIRLKDETSIRPYQEKSIGMMFAGGRAKSGIIVLPCGAGKTLVGIIATCAVRKPTIVLCNGSVPVDQWRRQFRQWTNISRSQVVTMTSRDKTPLPNKPCVLITTYSMLTYSGHRNEETQDIINQISSRDWGLMVIDEVQEMPAETFRTCISIAKAHTKLGLTATLVREDTKITDLNYLIGPKLYEANWIDLSEQGYIARVQCFEVWCKMPGPFFRAYYQSSAQPGKQRILSAMNPEKFTTCERLIRYHEARGDKILVFSDIIWVLKKYAALFHGDIVYGGTPEKERNVLFAKYRNSTKGTTLFISRIGDKAIDLPDARVLIQISSHFGARMQEAQRLGRILRPKAGKSGEFNAFFYTLISEDTREMFFSSKRQQFLVDQGYAFEVIQNQSERWPLDPSKMTFSTDEDQANLLRECEEAGFSEGSVEELDGYDVVHSNDAPGRGHVSLSSLSGGGSSVTFKNV